ncbi:hypothetical protein [Pseudomonas sp. MWU12-2323]|uniref:hypothetical protein n=1 Tax=Pseudomonas sp. MWU12-2323 TaxID=2651296 RepID=UPI00128D277E|nr:hypothetical protein [Pseudomonas sp. MWU12-2323]MPQ69453.1 hypothetical protein [Pseudomonas sp. MWU12-2323]
MTWLQHSIVQIDQQGIPCRFTTKGIAVLGWIMPDGMGVFQAEGIMVESRPETISTDHPEGLRRARQGAGNRHYHRHALDYRISDEGAWTPDGDKLVKQCCAVLADVRGQLTIHVVFKAGTAELLRSYTEFQSDLHACTHGADQVRQGCVGCKLQAGEVVRTSSGRTTSPFPKIETGNERKAGNSVKRTEQWLMENALAEAQARGDGFIALQFKASLDKPQRADKDAAEEYLFGHQPAVVSSPLQLLSSLSLPTRT